MVKKFSIATVAAFALATSALAQSLQGAVQQNTIDEMLEQRWQLHLCFPGSEPAPSAPPLASRTNSSARVQPT